MKISGIFNRAGANKAAKITRQFVGVVRMPHGTVKTGEVLGTPNATKTYEFTEVRFPWSTQIAVCTKIERDGLHNPEYIDVPTDPFTKLSKLEEAAKKIEKKNEYRLIEITPQTRYSDLEKYNADPNTFFWRRIVNNAGEVEYAFGTEIGQDCWVGGRHVLINGPKKPSKLLATLIKAAKEIDRLA